MLKAILFDFDGVILDSEEYHYEAFQRVFEEEGVSLTRESYYENCLGFNDVECFRWGLKGTGKIDEAGGIEELTDRKAVYFEGLLEKEMRFFPGVCEFIRAAGKKYPLAVTSMARRGEIEFALSKGGPVRSLPPDRERGGCRKNQTGPGGIRKDTAPAQRPPFLHGNGARDPAGTMPGDRGFLCRHSVRQGRRHERPRSRTDRRAGPLKAADQVLPSLEGVSLEEVEALFHS